MLFQTRKAFVHLQDTNEDISDEIWEISDAAYSNGTDTFKAKKGSKDIV